MQQERDIERKLVRKVTEAGGRCPKWTSPGNTGVPDRICLLPGRVIFVETKCPKGGRLSAKQEYWRDTLQALGLPWFLITNDQELEDFGWELEEGQTDEV